MEFTEMDHSESHIGAEVKIVLVSISDGEGIHTWEFPNVVRRISHLKHLLNLFKIIKLTPKKNLRE